MYIETLTIVHVLVSLVGIAAGFVALGRLARGDWKEGWMSWFLAATVATSITGFLFPLRGITPGIVIGILSIGLLAIALFARFAAGLQGGWRKAFILSATAAQYLNVFVLVVQSFLKVPMLHELAPTQSETPFAVTQLGVLVLCVWIGFQAVRGYRSLPA